MGSPERNAFIRSRGPAESAVSICLTAILLLIALAVLIKQSDYDISRFGMGTTTGQVGGGEIPFQLSLMAPAGFEVFSGRSQTETYNSENLYEKINGKAPFYTEAGFKKLSTQRFVSKDDENLWLELFVYDMGNTRNAFCVYSTQRRPDADILSLFHTSFGYRTSNALYFAQRNYYIELSGSSESNELFKAIITVAQEIMKRSTVVDKTELTELALFPHEYLIPGSIKLYLANAFGFEGLRDTFTAQYQIDDETITAFFSKRADSKDAKAVADSYRKFIIENGAKTIKAGNSDFEGKIFDFYGACEVIFSTGPFVAGIHEADNQQAAEKIAEIITRKLIETTK